MPVSRKKTARKRGLHRKSRKRKSISYIEWKNESVLRENRRRKFVIITFDTDERLMRLFFQHAGQVEVIKHRMSEKAAEVVLSHAEIALKVLRNKSRHAKKR